MYRVCFLEVQMILANLVPLCELWEAIISVTSLTKAVRACILIFDVLWDQILVTNSPRYFNPLVTSSILGLWLCC